MAEQVGGGGIHLASPRRHLPHLSMALPPQSASPRWGLDGKATERAGGGNVHLLRLPSAARLNGMTSTSSPLGGVSLTCPRHPLLPYAGAAASLLSFVAASPSSPMRDGGGQSSPV